MNGESTKAGTAELILASASPRRHELLERLPITFRVIPCERDEPGLDTHDATEPEATAIAIAAFKAHCVAEQYPDHWVLGADTLVACGGELLGKPRDIQDAERMLILQAQQPSLVITGLALVRQSPHNQRIVAAERTTVWMHDDAVARDAYLQSEDWRDKAGAYGIQSSGDALVERIAGSFSNVVGLPLERTARLLSQAGVLSANVASQFAD